MGTSLFRFVFNTLQIRLNDSSKPLWLPKLLRNAKGSNPQGKLLPLYEKNWSVGEITGEAGGMVTTPFVQGAKAAFDKAVRETPEKFSPPVALKTYYVIETPGHANAVVDLPRLEVAGLDNVFVEPEPEVTARGDGYLAKVVLTFGTARGPELPKTVRLSGQYRLSQSVSIAKVGESTVTTVKLDKAPFDWPTQVITGKGKFALDVTKVRAIADVLFTVDAKGTRVSVDKVTFEGTQGAPVITIDEKALTIDDVNTEMGRGLAWKTMAETALESPDGQAALVRGLNQALNREENRTRLADALTDSLRSQLDNAIGPATGDAKSVDDDIFGRLKRAVNDERSRYYLPVALLGVTSPVLDPYQAALDPIDLDIPDVGKGTLELHDTVVDGIANALAPADRIAFDPGVRVKATLSALPDGTEVTVDGGGKHKVVNPILVHGRPVLTIDGDKLEDPKYWFKVTVRGATADLTLGTSGGANNRLDTMVVTLESAVFAASDVEVTVFFDSQFDELINQELAKRKDDIRKRVVDAVNKGIAQDRPRVGQSITTRLRELIASKLDS
jgi:hypothetical protein